MSSLPRHNGKADTSVSFVVLCEAENYVQKMLLRNIFSLRFFSKIKIYFTVMLTTSNQKFLNFFRGRFEKVSHPTRQKSLIYFCLLSTRFRDIKFHFLKKNNRLSTIIFLQTFSASLSKLLILHFVFSQHPSNQQQLFPTLLLFV